MHKTLSFLGGIGLGAGCMYVFDPDRGNRRRAVARDKMIHIVRTSERAVDKASRDLSNRAWGLVAEARSALGDSSASDMVLVNRVRSCIGRAVSHPHAIEVSAQDGVVRLRGAVLADEVSRLIDKASGVAGVKSVENQLEVHNDATGVPALQGGRHHEETSELMPRAWSPAARVIAGTGGGLLGWLAVRQGGWRGAMLAVLGLGLSARAVTNSDLSDLIGLAKLAGEDGERGQQFAG